MTDGDVPRAHREVFVHLAVGPGHATLSVRRDATRSGRVYVGIAWCAPGDQYVRSRGRDIAHGRRLVVEQMARGHVNYAGAGFIFAASPAQLDKEAAEALGAWLAERQHEANTTTEYIDQARLRLDGRGIPRWLRLELGDPPHITMRHQLPLTEFTQPPPR